MTFTDTSTTEPALWKPRTHGLGYGHGAWCCRATLEIWRSGGYRGQLDVSFLFSPSLLFLLDLGPVQMATARVLPPTTGGGLSPCAGSAERSPSSGTDRLRDLQARMRAYELGFVSCWICFFSSCTGMQPRRSADKERDDVMAAGLWQGNHPSTQYIVSSCECSCTPSITLPIESTSFSNPRLQPYLPKYSYTRPYTDVRPYTVIDL